MSKETEKTTIKLRADNIIDYTVEAMSDGVSRVGYTLSLSYATSSEEEMKAILEKMDYLMNTPYRLVVAPTEEQRMDRLELL